MDGLDPPLAPNRRDRGARMRRVGRARLRMYFSFVSFLCLLYVSQGDEG